MNNQEIATTQRYTKNRSKLDIIAAILNVVNAREASKTRIMYGAYLSYKQIREYMPTLLDSNLVTTTNDGQSLYRIRERGLRFLELYGKVNEMIAREIRVGFVNPRDVEQLWCDQFDYIYREYHEATEGFVPPADSRWAFQDGPLHPGQVICHATSDRGTWCGETVVR